MPRVCSKRPRTTKLVKAKIDGPWRDVITVDVMTINGIDYKGTVKPIEARQMIYLGALKLKRENLHGMEMD